MSRVVAIFLLLPCFIGVMECLRGNSNSLCYTPVRIIKRVALADDKYEELPSWEPGEQCCEGYQDIADECTPICTKECLAGTCIEPNKCQCFEGFTGADCSTPVGNCIAGHFGENCDQACECNDSPCNRTTGLCTCNPGKMGNNCETTCPNDKFGSGCYDKCTCQRGQCDPISGHCECPAGYTGDDCSKVCDEGMYGEKCESQCNCLNGATCNHVTGECHCAAGYQGRTCSAKCTFGKWGDGCSQDCNCKDQTCDNVNGDCQCRPGYKGEQCGELCDDGFYGKNCSQTCSCINGLCSPINGTCTCNDGWTGIDCHQKNCSDWTYGLNCEEICECDQNNTNTCDLNTGKCICKDGWIGSSCSEECPHGYYGENCSNACDCVEGQYESCDKKTGQCFCKKAWKGQWCSIRCDCQHGGECDPNGRCNCTAGWIGENCTEPCKPGYYGRNCQDICLYHGLDKFKCDRILGDVCKSLYIGEKCETCICTNGECNTTTEACDCHPGYYGVNCTLVCPEGSYDKNCSKKCPCPKCRPTDGYCPCQENWNSTLCTDYCPIEMYNLNTTQCQELALESRELEKPILLISSITASCTLVIIIVIVSVCFWRRKAKSNNECTVRNPAKFFGSDGQDRSSRMTNTYEREEPTYEVIPDRPPDLYDTIPKFKRKHHDPLYFKYGGYELPKHVSDGGEEYVGLHALQERPTFDSIPACDRTFFGPMPIAPQFYGGPECMPLEDNHNFGRTNRESFPKYATPSTFQG